MSAQSGHLENGSSDTSHTNGNAVYHYGDYKRNPEER